MAHGSGPSWLVCAMLLSAPAQAGPVEAQCGKPCTISIGGQIREADYPAFHDLAAAHPDALVVLTGPGGSVGPALAIGREIRARGMRTVVPAGATCASACSLIWLAGTQRLLGADARIGFHALSTQSRAGNRTETHAFDSELVRYLNHLDYAIDVTATIVNTPSALVHWRDTLELNANGISTTDYP